MNVTRPDALWLLKLLDVIEFVYGEYPELFSEEDEETLKITGELIRGLNK